MYITVSSLCSNYRIVDILGYINEEPGKTSKSTNNAKCMKRAHMQFAITQAQISLLGYINEEPGRTSQSTNNAECMKRAHMQFAENAGPDQPAHSRRLIWAFVVRLQNQ